MTFKRAASVQLTMTLYKGGLRHEAWGIFVPRQRRHHGKFCRDAGGGVFELSGLKIGVRICYEVRFPEYFRELYRERTDLNIVLFYDVSDRDDTARYDLIKNHLVTCGVENVCPIASVNASGPFQSTPTCFIGPSGQVLAEAERGGFSFTIMRRPPRPSASAGGSRFPIHSRERPNDFTWSYIWTKRQSKLTI